MPRLVDMLESAVMPYQVFIALYLFISHLEELDESDLLIYHFF